MNNRISHHERARRLMHLARQLCEAAERELLLAIEAGDTPDDSPATGERLDQLAAELATVTTVLHGIQAEVDTLGGAR